MSTFLVLTALTLALGAFVIYPVTLHGHSGTRFDLDPSFRGLTPGKYFKNADGLWIFTRSADAENPKGIVYLTHGFGEHSGRYLNVFAELQNAGYTVRAMDMIGHGYSEGDRLYFDTVLDIPRDIRLLMKTYGNPNNLPVFLLGHSMGGLSTILTAMEKGDDLRGIILSGPALRDNVETPIDRETLIRLGGYLAAYVPHLPIASLDTSKISQEPDVVASALSDPLEIPNGKIRAAVGFSVLAAVDHVYESAGKFNVPFLLMHGDNDLLIKGSGSQEFYDKAGSKDKELVFVPGGHEFLHESHFKEWTKKIVEWMNARV